MSRIIRNINVLDLSSADEQSLEGVTGIENVNLLMSRKELGPALAKISLRNINRMVEDIHDLKLINGKYDLSESICQVQDPANLLINGEFTVHPDVSAEGLSTAVGALLVNGRINCPERLEGTIRAKLAAVNGTIVTYMDQATSLVHAPHFDEVFVRLLKPGTHLAALGKSQLSAVIDRNLLREKIALVEFNGPVTIRAEVLDALADRIHNPQRTNFTVIPEGATYLPREVTFDEFALSRFDKAVLYANGEVRFGEDVRAETVGRAIQKLYTTNMVICHADIRESVSLLCGLDTRIVDYRGRLLYVNGEHRLTPSELQFAQSQGGLTILVAGVLDIAESVDPALLMAALDCVDNSGVILGSEEQCAAIRMKLRTNDGTIEEKDASSESDEAGADSNQDIENVNYLKL